MLEQNEQYRNNDSARYTNDVVRYMLTFCLLAVPVGSIADNTRTHSPQKNGCKWDEVKDGQSQRSEATADQDALVSQTVVLLFHS